MAGRRSRIEGLAEWNKAMRALPDWAKDEIADELRDAGGWLVGAMRAQAPRRTGRMMAGIRYKILGKGLKLRAGLTDVKPGRDPLYYSRFQDLGRKEQLVRVKRLKPGGGVSSYMLRVRHMAGTHFVTGNYGPFKSWLNGRLNGLGNRIAARLRNGG